MVGHMLVVAFLPGASVSGLNRLIPLLRTMPVPGTVTPLPMSICSVVVTDTTLPRVSPTTRWSVQPLSARDARAETLRPDVRRGIHQRRHALWAKRITRRSHRVKSAENSARTPPPVSASRGEYVETVIVGVRRSTDFGCVSRQIFADRGCRLPL